MKPSRSASGPLSLLAAALLLAGGAPLRAQDESPAPGGEADGGGARFAVPVDAPATRALDLTRAESDERIVYDITLEVPGRKIPLTARLPLEAGQTSAALTLSVQEREGRRVSTLSLPDGPDGAPGDVPRLPLGLFAGREVEVRLVRKDAAEPALVRYFLN